MNRRDVLFAVASIGATGLGAARAWSAVAGSAPSFDVVDTANRRRSLAEFAGKTLVLEWTSPSCPFVAAQYDSGSMQELQTWATGRGVVWLSVLSTHRSRSDYLSADRAAEFVRARKLASTALLLDSSGAMGRAYGARTTPHMFVVAPGGALAYQGAIDSRSTTDPSVVRGSRNFVRAALDDLAAGRPVATPSTRPYGCSVGYGS